MARKNVDDYRRVLSFLTKSNRVAPDGVITLKDIVDAFVWSTDKSRPETIMRHIEYMCGLKVLQKRGEISYKLVDDWKDILERMR